MTEDFAKMTAPTPAMVEREITLEVFKANTWRLMIDHHDEVSALFAKIDAVLNARPQSPLINLVVAHCIIDGLRRRNRQMPNYALLEEAIADVAQHFGDTIDSLGPPA